MRICEEHDAFGKDEFTRHWLTVLQGCTSHAILQKALTESTPTSRLALAEILRVLGLESSVSNAEVALGLRLSGNNAQVELGLGLVVGCWFTLEDELQQAIAQALAHATLWPMFVPQSEQGLEAVNVCNQRVASALGNMVCELMAL